ncbi:MAG: hypothetical protein KME20_07760 [Kaiparowitsia implicata GSE-PSE-MK54-09C]|nr:hypothetical protein [Kaiparowitsia implicata GSE-PSE-MK54-09C]
MKSNPGLHGNDQRGIGGSTAKLPGAARGYSYRHEAPGEKPGYEFNERSPIHHPFSKIGSIDYG